MSDVTRVLQAIDAGDPLARNELFPLVYDELRKLAAQKMAHEKPGQTLDPTGLVHEAFLRLVASAATPSPDAATTDGSVPPVAQPTGQQFANRPHFFAAAAEAMRRILVDNARRKGRDRHGGGRHRVEADLNLLRTTAPDEELLALHEALEQFATHDPHKAKLVELRFFGGLTLNQAAECLGVSPSTADRAWRYARAWLYTAIADDNSEEK